MKRIYKYPLETTDAQIIKMPANAEVLTVKLQGETPCIWAKIETSNEMDDYRVRIIGTGHAIYDDETLGKYVGTYLINEDCSDGCGIGVFHVWIKETKGKDYSNFIL